MSVTKTMTVTRAIAETWEPVPIFRWNVAHSAGSSPRLEQKWFSRNTGAYKWCIVPTGDGDYEDAE